MIHRALMGSLERFFGILIEHYAGAFPLWLCPVQVIVLTISEKTTEFALSIYDRLKDAKIRAEINTDNEKIGFKIREATLRKIPYLVIVGEKEAREGRITVRNRKGENSEYKIEEFVDVLKMQIQQKL